MTFDRVDFEEGALTFETLKRRRQGIFRSVPVPQSLLDALDLVHGLREKSGKERKLRIKSVSVAVFTRDTDSIRIGCLRYEVCFS